MTQVPARRASPVALAAAALLAACGKNPGAGGAAGDATAASVKVNEDMATALELDGSKIDSARF